MNDETTRRPLVTGGVVRLDGLREELAPLREALDFGALTPREFADEVARVLDAVPDVPTTEDGRASLAGHIKAGMLRGRVRLPDEPDEVCPKCGRHPGDADVAVVLPDVPPAPPAVDKHTLARLIAETIYERNKTVGGNRVSAVQGLARHLADYLIASGVPVAAADVRARALEDAADESMRLVEQPANGAMWRKFLRDRAVSEREGDGGNG